MIEQPDHLAVQWAAGLEQPEIGAWWDLHSSASESALKLAGAGCVQIGSALASYCSKVDTLAFNRILGFGFDGDTSAERLEALSEVYRRAKVPRVFLQLITPLRTPALDSHLAEHGFTYYNNWVKLTRDTEPIPSVKTKLHIEQIGPEYSEEFSDIVISSFEWDKRLSPLVAATVGQPNWLHYLAFDGDKPVATAALYVTGVYGWIDMAATLADYRGRGAQGALVERRFADAARLRKRSAIIPQHDSLRFQANLLPTELSKIIQVAKNIGYA
jgi:hypothetical protein